MPAMQEQLPAMARDGQGNDDHVPPVRSMLKHDCLAPSFRSWFDGLTTNGICLIRDASNTQLECVDGLLPSTQEPLQAAFRLANRPVPKVILVEYDSRCYADA